MVLKCIWYITIHNMIPILKNVYINKLDDIVNEDNNAYHRTIKMKSVDVKDNTYIESMELLRYNDKYPEFKVLH